MKNLYDSQTSIDELYKRLNQTTAEFSDKKVIYEFFEEQAEFHPDNIALSFQGETMTYKELNRKTNQLAHYLRSVGVKPDEPVGIMVERSFEMMIGIFAVLKAGGAYLPINPQLPEERICYYMEDSRASLLLTVLGMEKEKFEGVTYIFIDEYSKYENLPDTNLDIAVTSENIAYIIYTSGSTGKPKGVMIEHKSLVNRLTWMQKNFQITEDDTLLQKTSFSFDVSVWELFWWSMVGARLVLLKPHKEKDPRAIVKAINKDKVTIIHFVPSVLEMFLDYIGTKFDLTKIASLKYVVVSGEELSKKTALFFNELLEDYNISLWNLYGPTEATIDVTAFCSNGISDAIERIPIGKPIDNIQIYVLDGEGNRLPQDEVGELCIAGIGVARGYIHNERLTKERFIDNPFGEGKMYKTGDLACWNANGELEYHGRMDYQVKIRGLRIELGEIESQLLVHHNLKKAAVIVRQMDLQNKTLIAFYQSTDNSEITDLKEYLGRVLPDYMIPAKFIRLDEFPINQNGKLDRNSLNDYEKEGKV